MCKPASGVFTKGHKAHWSKYTDSHEEIIEEHKLNADGVGGPNIVRFEISPPDCDLSKPLSEWEYRVDQHVTPEWYDKDDAEKAARAMLTEWAAQKIIREDREKLEDGEYWIISGTVNEVRQGGTVNEVWGTVNEVRRGGTVNEVRQGGIVNEVWGTVNEVWQGGTVNAVWGTVNAVRQGGTVNAVWRGGTVITYVKMELGMMKHASAVLVDRSVDHPVCYVGIQKAALKDVP